MPKFDMRRLKETAKAVLPENSIARSVILAEPDQLPTAEAVAKFKVLDRLLVEELERGPSTAWER